MHSWNNLHKRFSYPLAIVAVRELLQNEPHKRKTREKTVTVKFSRMLAEQNSTLAEKKRN